MGDNLKYMIGNDKDSIFIGCEPFLNGIANFLATLKERDQNRVKIFDKDVRILLSLLPKKFFSKIIILFPDPWTKRRHRKRRLFNKININLFLESLKKDGEIYFGTDVEDYFFEVKKYFLNKNKDYKIKNERDFHGLPNLLSETKYSKKSLKKKIIPKYLVIKKKVDIL